MIANTLGSWLKRWGLAIIAGLCVVLYFMLKLLPAPKTAQVVQQAKADAKALADNKTQALADHKADMDAKRAELDTIKAIPDDKARLQALADFANRKKNG